MQKHLDHTLGLFFKRTISAQIHFVGFLLAIAGIVVFCMSPNIVGTHFVACLVFMIFGASTMGISATYHFLNDGFLISKRAALLLENLDQTSIYLFIAGTYTPILLNVLSADLRTPMIIGIWSMAAFGILYTQFKSKLPNWAQSRYTYTFFYLAMGWLMVFRIQDIVENLSFYGSTFFYSAAAAYSIGAIMYAFKWPNFKPGIFGYHELWHTSVVAGFSCHFVLILGFY